MLLCYRWLRCQAEAMTGQERAEVLASFFDAHWRNQIFPHPRYRELFVRRHEGERFNAQDVRDLQMWFNLAWCAKEIRDEEVEHAQSLVP